MEEVVKTRRYIISFKDKEDDKFPTSVSAVADDIRGALDKFEKHYGKKNIKQISVDEGIFLV